MDNQHVASILYKIANLLDLKGENFFKKVYEVAKLIPYGRVTSYGAIAKYLGAARSARMVGWAMNASHTMEEIPAHRVVNRKGLLTGKHHFDGTNLMQQLLESLQLDNLFFLGKDKNSILI